MTAVTSARSTPGTAWRNTGWFDPAAETVWIHRLRNGSLAVAHTFGPQQTLRSPLLAGFELDLDDVFR